MLLLLGILQYSLRFCTACFYVFVVTASSNNRLDDASRDRSQNQAAAFRFLSSQVLGDGGELFSDIFSYRFLDRFCDGFGSPDGAKMLPKSVKNRVQEGT